MHGMQLGLPSSSQSKKYFNRKIGLISELTVPPPTSGEIKSTVSVACLRQIDPQYFDMMIEQLDHYIAHFILKRLERYYDVDGAPFKIGQKVWVLNNPNADQTFDTKFANKFGEVLFFEYDGGCGQSFPFDPMIGVRFGDGLVEEFWNEELKLIA
jgi:hypothetical protein